MCYNTGAMSEPRLILASQSPRRRELLHLLGLPFEVTVADVTEEREAGETPVEMVTRLSRAKAEVATAQEGLSERCSALVIACDTIVALEGRPEGTQILGKPRDSQEARAMLRLLRGRSTSGRSTSGRSHVVYSAITVLNQARQTVTQLAKTRLTMRTYTEREISTYVASGDPLDKAGAYAIQHEGFHPVATIEGCYASVMGLPLCHLTRCLCHWGRPPAVDVPAACQAHTDRRCNVYQEIIGS